MLNLRFRCRVEVSARRSRAPVGGTLIGLSFPQGNTNDARHFRLSCQAIVVRDDHIDATRDVTKQAHDARGIVKGASHVREHYEEIDVGVSLFLAPGH